MSPGLRIKLGWSVAAAIVAGAALAAALAVARCEVHLVNGLDEPVTIRLGRASALVPKGGHVEVTAWVGGAEAEVIAAGGRVLDRHQVVVPSSGQVVYNALGAAPLFDEAVVYSSPADRARAPQPQFTLLAGQRLVTTRADDVLRGPPKSVEVKAPNRWVVRHHVGVGEGGWHASLQALLNGPGGLREAAALAARLAVAMPDDEGVRYWRGTAAAALEGPGAAVELALDDFRRHPGEPGATWGLHSALRRAGRVEQLRTLVRERAARAPDSPLALASLGRALPAEEGSEVLAEALRRFPADHELLESAARQALQRGRPEEALAHFARLPPEALREGSTAHAYELAALRAGRPKEALDVALAAATGKGAATEDVVRYVRMTSRNGAPAPRPAKEVVTDWSREHAVPGLFLAAELGQSLPDGPQEQLSPAAREALQITVAAGREPASALERVRLASAGAFTNLDEDVATLLLAEACRARDRVAAEALYGATHHIVPLSDLVAWVERGERPEAWWRLGPEATSSFLLARARWLEAEGRDGTELRTASFQADPLTGMAARANLHWPRPTPPPARLVLVP